MLFSMSTRGKKPGNLAIKRRMIVEEIHMIQDKLANGWKRRDCVRWMMEEKAYSECTAKRRVKEACDKTLEEMKEMERHELAAQVYEMAQTIAAKAMDKNQLSNAIGALRFITDLTKLTGGRN